jgi:hypothetical protein
VNLSRKGLVFAVLQVVLVVSVAAKFWMDRARYPRIWVKTQSVDPSLPIRGRYIAMRLTVGVEDSATPGKNRSFPLGKLVVKDGGLMAEEVSNEASYLSSGIWIEEDRRGGEFTLQPQISFFLPEHAPELLSVARNGELWAEVTVPESGLPRPIRLAIKRGGDFIPIEAK